MVETVLVTGGSGFVAGWCIVELLRRGYAVRATVRSLAKEPAVRAAIASAGVDTGSLTFVVADLTQDAGWDGAVTGCQYVIHVASPLGAAGSRVPETIIAPAVDGTLRVLRAATHAGVKRVVMTSAATAATPSLQSPDGVSDETVWFDPDERKVDVYRLSKRLAERAAWDFMREHGGPTTLTTVLPGAVFGPALTADSMGSVQVIARLLQGRVPGNPRLGFEVVDVRDLADLHVLAMTSQQAAGERFIAVGQFMWMADISRTLRARLGDAAAKVPTRALPDFVLRAMSLLDPKLRMLTPILGRKLRHTSAKAQRVLGWHARPADATLIDCANSLMVHDAV